MGTRTIESAGPAVETPLSRLRWLMIGLVFLATIVNYLDRQTLSIVAPTLREQFHMSNEDYGYVVAAFMLAYTIANGISGPVIDRLGTRLGYALCMAWWSTAAVLHMLARGPLSMGVFRFLLGMGEAGNWPAGVKVVTEWFPPRERALAAGIFNSGAALGAILAAPLVAWLVAAYGWPQAFVFVGVSGYLWLIVWGLIYYTPGQVAREARARPAPPWALLRTRFLASFTLAKIFVDPVWYFYIFWFPEFLKARFDFDLAAIGRTAWIPFLSAGLGSIVGGWLSGMLIRRGMPVPSVRKVSLIPFALLMTAAIPAVMVSRAGSSIALVSLATFGYTGFTANTLAFPGDVFPKNMVGSIWGLASMGSGFGGMFFSWLSGRVIDRHGYTPVFIGYGLLPLVALAVILFVMGPLRPRDCPPQPRSAEAHTA